MSGYTPVFSDIYTGTLYGRWPAAAVWASLLPLMDKFGRIDMSMQAIAGMTGWPLDLLDLGIKQLMEPDPHSRTPDCDGRRLVPIAENRQWGWQAVNHGKYREKARKHAYDQNRTESGADAARKQAHRDVSRGVPTRPDVSRAVPLSDTNTNTDTNSKDKEPDALTRARSAPEYMRSDWQPNEANRKWLEDSGLTPSQIESVTAEFVLWAVNSEHRKTERNWQIAFARNPKVKSAIGAAATRAQAKDAQRASDEHADVLYLAGIMGMTKLDGETERVFATRVLSANQKRIADIERLAS